ncbi:MAG: hypothetical protein H6815_08380 [Phycisphaeraceae bacterium]|nr:hypothetical protein [Phycisphaerales bacterium]MCB9860457.1 hypothetical protein [Phycisphaeraceae bacterium]
MRTLLPIFACALLVLTSCEKQEPASSSPAVTTSASQGDLHIRASLDSATIETSDKVALTLSVDAPIGASIDQPDISEATDPFRVEAVIAHDPTIVDADTIRRTWTYTLVPFLPGDYSIGPIDIEMRPMEGNAIVATAPALDIRVNSVIDLGQDTELSLDNLDVTDYIEDPAADARQSTSSRLLPVAVGIIALSGLAGGAYFVSRRLRKPTEAERRRKACNEIFARATALQQSIHQPQAHGSAIADEIAGMIRTLLELTPNTLSLEVTRNQLESAYAALDTVRFGGAYPSAELLSSTLHTTQESAGRLSHIVVSPVSTAAFHSQPIGGVR